MPTWPELDRGEDTAPAQIVNSPGRHTEYLGDVGAGEEGVHHRFQVSRARLVPRAVQMVTLMRPRQATAMTVPRCSSSWLDIALLPVA